MEEKILLQIKASEENGVRLECNANSIMDEIAIAKALVYGARENEALRRILGAMISASMDAIEMMRSEREAGIKLKSSEVKS